MEAVSYTHQMCIRDSPIPAVMVSCGTMEESNIITVAWTGIINTNPAMVYTVSYTHLPHKQWSMWFNSTQREEPYQGLKYT